MKVVRRIGNLIYIFQTFRKINLASFLYDQSSKSLLKECLYFSLPVFFFSGNILIMILNNVLYSDRELFTYCNDLSNSLCLSFLYFLSYYLSGYFPLKFDEFLRIGIKHNFFECMAGYFKDRKKSYFLLLIMGVILAIISFLAGFSFYTVAKSNVNAYWIYNLNYFGRVYYCIFLTVTWYHSLSLLGMAFSGSFVIYFAVKNNQINYVEKDFNKNMSITSAVDVVISTFSYGLFYIIGSVLFILNDRVAEKYKVFNAFHDDIASFALVFCILILVIIEYIPLYELMRFMKRQKYYLISRLNASILEEQSLIKIKYLIEERNSIMEQNLISTSITNKIIFILSVLIPSIGVVFQGIELFGK